MTRDETERRRALVALVLVAPAPSLGVWAAMVAAPGPLGHGVFLAAKIWLLCFPAFWWLAIENGRPSLSPPVRGGLGAGLLSGLVLGGIILSGSWLTGVFRMDAAPLLAAADGMGLASPRAFLAGALGWILVNSLIEEYVYRWFIFHQCELLFSSPASVLVSAAIFTVHHIIAVSRYLDPGFTALASAGVFGGGLIWAWLYRRYRSIWPGWISHVVADVAVFAVGWRLLFG